MNIFQSSYRTAPLFSCHDTSSLFLFLILALRSSYGRMLSLLFFRSRRSVGHVSTQFLQLKCVQYQKIMLSGINIKDNIDM